MTDVHRARTTVTQSIASEVDPAGIARAVRYAAMLSSARSIGNQLPPPIFPTAVSKGVWTIETAWKYATLVDDLKQRSEIVVILAPYLTHNLMIEALDAWTIPNPAPGWVNVIVALAPHLPPDRLGSSVSPLLERLYSTGDVEAFARLAPHVGERTFENILSVLAAEFWASGRISDIIAAVAAHLPARLLRYAIGLLRRDFPEYGPHAWKALAPRLGTKLLDAAIEEVKGTLRGCAAIIAYSGLLPQLARLGDPDRALRAAFDTDEGVGRSELIISLLPCLIDSRRSDQAMQLAESLPSDYFKGQAIASMAAALPLRLIDRALVLARSLERPRSRHRALQALAPRLSGAKRNRVLEGALAAAKEIRDRSFNDSNVVESDALSRSIAFAELLTLFIEGRNVVRALEMVDLIFDIPVHELDDHFDVRTKESEAAQYEKLRARALGSVFRILSKKLAAKQLARVKKLQRDQDRGLALSLAAQYLSESLLQNALDAARSVDEIVALAPHLPQACLRTVLRKTRKKFLRDVHGELIGGLAPWLTEALLEEAIETSQSIEDSLGQAVAIASLSSFLPNGNREAVAELALAAAQATGPLNDGGRAQALSDIAEFLPVRVLRLAIGDAKSMAYDFLSSRALAALLPALGVCGQVEEAWAESRSLESIDQVSTIARLIPLASDELLSQLPDILPSLVPGPETEALLSTAVKRLSRLQTSRPCARHLRPYRQLPSDSVIGVPGKRRPYGTPGKCPARNAAERIPFPVRSDPRRPSKRC